MQHPEPFPWHQASWYGGGHGVIAIVLFLILVGVVIWLVVRMHSLESKVSSWGRMAPAAPAGAAPRAPQVSPWSDPAVAEARMRFARGELDRDAYLLIAQDLGASTPAPPPAAPPAEEPPGA
jgi:hypothetical protein